MVKSNMQKIIVEKHSLLLTTEGPVRINAQNNSWFLDLLQNVNLWASNEYKSRLPSPSFPVT